MFFGDSANCGVAGLIRKVFLGASWASRMGGFLARTFVGLKELANMAEIEVMLVGACTAPAELTTILGIYCNHSKSLTRDMLVSRTPIGLARPQMQ